MVANHERNTEKKQLDFSIDTLREINIIRSVEETMREYKLNRGHLRSFISKGYNRKQRIEPAKFKITYKQWILHVVPSEDGSALLVTNLYQNLKSEDSEDSGDISEFERMKHGEMTRKEYFQGRKRN